MQVDYKSLPFPIPKIIALYGIPLPLLPLLQAVVLHRLGLSWQDSFTDSLVSNLLFYLLAVLLIIQLKYYQPGGRNQLLRLIFAAEVAFVFCFILCFLPGILLPDHSLYLQIFTASIPIRFVFALMVLFFITLINWIQNQLTEQKEMEKRSLQTEQLMKEAELASLRQQLHPHFLFNSLNSINALISSKPEAARKMIQQLSDFLRGTLKKEDLRVSLGDELEHLQLYLEIEKVRFGSRLTVEFSTTPESLKQKLPALLLQPVLENAIKFGLYDLTGEVLISITSKIDMDFLVIEISNPFDPQSQSDHQGAGFGLPSIQRRLQLIYARKDLIVSSKKENIYTSKLKIPLDA